MTQNDKSLAKARRWQPPEGGKGQDALSKAKMAMRTGVRNPSPRPAMSEARLAPTKGD